MELGCYGSAIVPAPPDPLSRLALGLGFIAKSARCKSLGRLMDFHAATSRAE